MKPCKHKEVAKFCKRCLFKEYQRGFSDSAKMVSDAYALGVSDTLKELEKKGILKIEKKVK